MKGLKKGKEKETGPALNLTLLSARPPPRGVKMGWIITVNYTAVYLSHVPLARHEYDFHDNY